MKPKDLVTNIHQAREHIRRLKKEADRIDTSLNNPTIASQDDPLTFNQYVNNALYSLAKNDTDINTKIQEFKSNKLPSIYQKSQKIQQQHYYLNGYRKYKKQTINKSLNNTKINTKSKINSLTTKPDDSFSFTLENKKIKIHSFGQKHKPVEITSQSKLGSILQYDNTSAPEPAIQKQGLSHSSIRNRKYEQKVSLVNFNESLFNMKDINSQKFNESLLKMNGKTSQNGLSKREQALEYDSVVDSFSSHIFMIINGMTIKQGPQFASFQRIYKSIFNKIEQQIEELEKIIKKYGVKYARLDGKKLAYLCLKQNIKQIELIDCLIEGRGEIVSQIPQNKYKGIEGKTRAANKIKAYWRMTLTKAKYQLLKNKTIILQQYFRRQRFRIQLQNKIIRRNSDIMTRFQQRQQQFQQNYKRIKKQKRIEIHINSIQTDEQKRLTMENFIERQNIQLSRIFNLRDQNVVIIFVSAKEISHEVINYYYKILELSEINNFKDRLFFMSPKHYGFPEHFSTTRLLYYCSRTLNQLKNITETMPAILYAGHPCNELVKICDILGCFLFSGQPSKMKQFMSKSQTKRLLKNLAIDTLPGSMQMYDYGQFLNTFSVLIVKNPEVMTWVFKIDDQFEGRGLAYVELGKSKAITALLKKLEYQSGSQLFATDVVSEPLNQQITIKIRDYLKEKLSAKLVIATPSLYRSYEEYMGRFIKKGGIIEAHPPCSQQFLNYPSISFCLEPDGEMKVLTTYEKILAQPFRSIACSFPQKSLQYDQILSLCRQLVESFKIRKLFGYFTVDLIFYAKDNRSKYWVMGIEPFLNNYASSYYLFDALMQGKYLPEKGLYLTEAITQNTAQRENHSQRDNQSRNSSFQVGSINKSYSSISQSSLVSRQYIFIPHFLNKNFMRTNIKQFFKQARIEEFNFDIAQKLGICMMLFDELTSGELGLMTVCQNKEEGVEKLKKVLQFITRITQIKNLPYGKSNLQPSTDAIQITDVVSKFLTLERKEKRKDAKKKAVEKYRNQQDLQLIV